MKKIIFLFLTLFLFKPTTYALKFHFGDKVDDIYVYKENNGNVHNGKVFRILDEDGNLVYCIDPLAIGIKDEDYTVYYKDNHPFNLSKETVNRINLIAYFGYGYQNHIDIKWYGITQFLIWNEIGIDKLYFADINGNKVDIYSDEINEINSLIDEYLIKPDLSNIQDIYDMNTTYTFEDKNNVLENYRIHRSEIDSKIEDNKLIVTTTKKGILTINLIKYPPKFDPTIFYYLEGSQPLIRPGYIDVISYELKMHIVNGKITVLKRTKEDQVLEGAEYGLYKDGVLLETKITNKDGKIIFDNLNSGVYQIKEINAPPGYLIDLDEHTININEYGSSHGLVLYNDPIYEEIDVFVPDTGVRKYVSVKALILVYVGITIIILSRKKTTH